MLSMSMRPAGRLKVVVLSVSMRPAGRLKVVVLSMSMRPAGRLKVVVLSMSMRPAGRLKVVVLSVSMRPAGRLKVVVLSMSMRLAGRLLHTCAAVLGFLQKVRSVRGMVSHGQPDLSFTFPGTAHAEMSSTSEDFKELIGLTSLILCLLTLDLAFVDTKCINKFLWI